MKQNQLIASPLASINGTFLNETLPGVTTEKIETVFGPLTEDQKTEFDNYSDPLILVCATSKNVYTLYTYCNEWRIGGKGADHNTEYIKSLLF